MRARHEYGRPDLMFALLRIEDAAVLLARPPYPNQSVAPGLESRETDRK